MEKQISFSGVALTPYNDISPDGQLSACINLQSYAGSLRPSEIEGTEYQISESGFKLITIHVTSNYRHMIFYDGSALYWADEKAGTLNLKYITSIRNLSSVQAIGNTLSVISDDGITYVLYKNDGYLTLGDIPELNLNFALKGIGSVGDSSKVSVETIPYADLSKDFTDTNKRIITDAVMVLVNDYVNEQHEKGNFIFPFLLRYALRLYNDDLIRHSVPILISCTNKESLAVLASFERDRDITELLIQAIGCYFKLYFKSDTNSTVFDNWSDVIKSVDIFISEPIYTYYPDKLCERFSFITSSAYAICSVTGDTSTYIKRSFQDIFTSNNPDFDFKKPISLPYKSKDEIAKAIEDTSNFYFLTSVLTRELPSSFTEVNVESTSLSNISFKERMTDDYASHDKLYPQTAFVYNRRLNIANIRKELFEGHALNSVLTYQEDYNAGYKVCHCYIYSRINNKEVIFKMPSFIFSSDITIDYFFFPGTYAYKAVFTKGDTILTLELRNHPLLNGVYYCSGFNQNAFVSGTIPSESGDSTVYLPNVIYTSQVDNPFYFPVQGINTVGTGEIIGLSTITTALSQGQFGTFPLMAFCTDGNYALQVNSEGLFSAVTPPMQRDVCTNRKSITQIDGAIIFVTARGVMIADGSTIQPLSNILNGVLSDLSQFAAKDGLSEDMLIGIPSVPPVDFFQNCIIAYDYVSKRLLFMSESSEENAFGWQYCIDEQSWQQINFGNAISIYNVFPSSYVQQIRNGSSRIVRLDSPYNFDASQFNEGYVLTRPLKLDTLQYKSFRQVALVGSFSQAQTVGIYGSNNGTNWFLLGKSNAGRILTPGRYFKYYRFSIETNLANSENITGLRVEYDIRPERRFR